MEIKRLAELSALYLSEAEAADAQHELARMLEFVDEITKQELSAQEGFVINGSTLQTLRADTVRTSVERELLLAAAPLVKDGFYRVTLGEVEHE